MNMDIIATVLDEIALEGLEGITLPSLWIRLQSDSDARFSLDIREERVQQYIWSRVILPKATDKNLQIFRLPKPRPNIQLYNRYDYVNPDTGTCIENDDVPEDVYGIVTPINDGNVRGSCNTIETRVDITKTVLEKNWTLQEALEKHGKKLIVVASQKLREYSLRIPCFDPCLPLTPMQYCVLEKVGRARKFGEVTVGKEASKYHESPKTLFYYRKILLRRGLIKKQQHIISMKKSGQNRIGLVLTLPRFHFMRITPLAKAAMKTNDVLLREPNLTCDYYALQEKVGIKKKLYKAMFANYTKNFFVHEPDIESAPNKKCKRREVKLIKEVKLDTESDDENDGEEEEQGEEGDAEIGGYSLKKIRNFAMFAKSFDPKRIRVDRQLTTQALETVDNFESPEGISLRELGEELRLPKLEIRQLSRVLERCHEVTTMMTDHGKQKIKKYQSIHKIDHTRKIFEEEGLSLKFGSNETLTFMRRANIILEAVRKNKIFDELVTFKKLISASEKDSPYTIDRKSIKTIINKLAVNGYVRYIKTLLTCQEKEHKLEIVCEPSITANSPLVRDRIETNKFRLFGATGEDSSANRVNKKSRSSCRNAVQGFESELKYKPSIAKRYGYEPKMKKLMTLYKFLFHVMCVTQPGNYKDWRKHIPKLILNAQGCCTLGDIIPRIPLSVFVSIVFVNYVIPELEDYLNDPNRRNLTLSLLPADLRRKLMFKRKYIFNIFEELVSLSHMGLVKLDYTDACLKETAKITIITRISFADCDTVKCYDFTTLSDVERFASDLSFHCSRNDCTNCSLDPRLFAHNQRNWTYSPSIRNHLGNLSENSPPSTRLKSSLVNSSDSISQLRYESLKSNYGNRKRPANSNLSSMGNDVTTDVIPAKQRRVTRKKSTTLTEKSKESKKAPKAKKTKRRLLRDETDIKAIKLMKKRRVQWSKEEDSFLLICRIASILLDPTCPTFVCVSGTLIRDELHKYLPEISMDKTVKACQRRLNYMLKKSRTRENVIEWVSDVKQEIDSLNIGRPNTPKSDIKGWSEAFLKYLHILLTKFQAYHLSLSSASSPNLSTTYETLDQLKSAHNIVESHTSILPFKPDLYKEPENIVDMCISVIQNVITSTLMYNVHEANRQASETNYSHTLFKIYQCYPDVLIRSVIIKLSKNRIMTKVRRLANNAPNSFKARGLAPYKISQAYLFKLRTKFFIDTLTVSIDEKICTIVDSGTRNQAAIICHLFAANMAHFDITIPDNFVFIDKGKLENRTRSELASNPSISGESSRSLIEDPRLASRFALYCFREKLCDDTFAGKQHSQDYLAIKSCPVTCTSDDISFDKQPFMKLLEIQGMLKSETLPGDTSLIRVMYDNLVEFVKSCGEMGATEEEIMEFCNFIWPEEAIAHLTSTGELFEVGVMNYRIVHYNHIDHWLVHSVNQHAEPGKPKTVRFVPKLWKDAYGTVHRKILFHYLAFVLGTLLNKPGISRQKLYADVSEIMPPVQVLDILRFLKSLKCVDEIVIKEPKTISLFDGSDSIDEYTNETLLDQSNVKTVIHYKATAISFINLCQVKEFLTT